AGVNAGDAKVDQLAELFVLGVLGQIYHDIAGGGAQLCRHAVEIGAKHQIKGADAGGNPLALDVGIGHIHQDVAEREAAESRHECARIGGQPGFINGLGGSIDGGDGAAEIYFLNGDIADLNGTIVFYGDVQPIHGEGGIDAGAHAAG